MDISQMALNAKTIPELDDQAAGLRRLFHAKSRVCWVPVAANPYVNSRQLLEALTDAFCQDHAHITVVDAGPFAPNPSELATVMLDGCFESINHQVSYLAARGLPLQYFNTFGSCSRLLHDVQRCVMPDSIVLVHAAASELARLFEGMSVRPVVLAGNHSDSVVSAYGNFKWLHQRLGAKACDLLIASPESRARKAVIAAADITTTMQRCMVHFLQSQLLSSVDVCHRQDGQWQARSLDVRSGLTQMQADTPFKQLTQGHQRAYQGDIQETPPPKSNPSWFQSAKTKSLQPAAQVAPAKQDTASKEWDNWMDDLWGPAGPVQPGHGVILASASSATRSSVMAA